MSTEADLPAVRPAADLVAGSAVLAEAVAVLAGGGLVALPTETVYGLAADATSDDAVARIYAAKGRPGTNPLISHVEDFAAARRHGVFDDTARRLAEAFWPGPLTLVVPRAPGSPVAERTTAGLPTLALRVPASDAMRLIAATLGRPLAAPSANRSGRVSPTTAADVVADLGFRVSLVIDGGPCRVGVESTIVGCFGPEPTLLRPGGTTVEAIETVLGRPLLRPELDASRPSAPGQLLSHYAPRAAVRLHATSVAPGEALLAFGPTPLPGAETAAAVLNLSPRGDLAEAATNLFTMLRALDRSGAPVIAVAPLPHTGLGLAIADRLTRAAAPRPA
ncbi:L-threonylcarbamoyladenylate synthase [Segnochrobactraceae bacterium EtOH-i3]